MKKQPKYINVLIFLYEKIASYENPSVHYEILQQKIFSKEVINRNRTHGRIDKITCLYMGRLAKKNYVQAEYRTWRNGCVYFVGYYITNEGINFLKEKKVI
jgi:hypothetical protein